MIDRTSFSWPGWETVRLIGRGSFGAVYEIQRDVFGEVEKAALKVISIPQNASDIDEMYSDGYNDESITSTFQDHLKGIVGEYSLMRKMNGCPNIVSCDDIRYIQHDDGFGWDIFIKMELLTPLTRVLLAQVSEDAVVTLAKDLCNALVVCKEHNIVHRDIKPQNIFVSQYGDYKLGDFGIAKTVEKTMGGTKIGTYKYMAPEVYNNQPYNSSADIYSLGLVLYWILNERRLPFLPLPPENVKAGMEEQARLRRFSGEQLPPPAHGSEKLKQIVLKACAFDPRERYQSAKEMREDLQSLSDGTIPTVAPQPVAVPEITNVPKAADDPTVGLFFNRNTPPVAEDQDKTVGPTFASKNTEPAEEDKIMVPRFEEKKPEVPVKKPENRPVKKKKFGLIGAAVLVVSGIMFGLWYNGGTWQQPSTQNVIESFDAIAEETKDHVPVVTEMRSQDEEVVSSPILEFGWASCSGSELPTYSFSDTTAMVSCSHWTSFDSTSVQIDITNAYGHDLNFSVSDFNLTWEDHSLFIRPSGIPCGVYWINLSDGKDYANFVLVYGFPGETYLARQNIGFYDHKIINKTHAYYLKKTGTEMEATLDPTDATVFSSERGPAISGTYFPCSDNGFLRSADGVPFSFRQYRIFGGEFYYTLERLNMYLAVDASGNLYATGTLSEECYWQLKAE